MPDEVLGEAVRAYVVLEEGAKVGERDVHPRACRERLEAYMVPREVMMVAELPQTASGKVRKKSLLEGAPAE